MKSRVEPPIHPISIAIATDDSRRFGIEVIARVFFVVHQDPYNGQRALPGPVEIIQVILIDDLDVDCVRIGNGALHDFDNLIAIEFLDHFAVERIVRDVPSPGSLCDMAHRRTRWTPVLSLADPRVA